MATKKEREISEAKAKLLDILKPGDTIYTHVEHVSRSGMMRVISAKVIRDNEPRDISWLVAKALDWSYQDKWPYGVKVNGCGMDMAFHLVTTLASTLWWQQADEMRKAAGVERSKNWSGNVLERDAGYWLTQRDM
jgi:hypothetical protein